MSRFRKLSEGIASEHPDVAGQKEFANRADEILAQRKKDREKSRKNAKLDAIGRRLFNMSTIKTEEVELGEAHWDPVTKKIGEKKRTGSDPELQHMAATAASRGPKKRVPLGQGTRNKASKFTPSSPEQAKADKERWNSYWESIHKKEEIEISRDRMRFMLDEAKRGLCDNIRKKGKRGERPAKPGEKGYPKTLNIEEGIKQARKNVGASKCWTGKKLGNPPTKMKGGKEVPNCVPEAVVYGGEKKEPEDKRMTMIVTAADQKANTKAWQKYKAGHPSYKAAPHVEEGFELLEKAPPGAKFERMVKHIKKGYSKDGLTDKERSIAFATAWKQYNRTQNNEEYLLEKARGTRPKRTVHAYDVDETLFSHGKKGKPNVQVHVKDESGKIVKSLSNQEFNTHKLEKGHSYDDFREFKSADKFKETSSPNKKVIKDIKRKQARGQNVHIITARSKFDKPSEFQGHLKKHGVDVDKSNIHYTGGMKGSDVGDKKVKVANALAKKSGAKKIHMYDDAAKVHKSFEAEKKEKPTSMKIKTHMVAPDKKTGESKVRSYQATK